MTFNHILVPLDGSRMAEQILPVVTALGTRLGSRITLLHIVERDAPAQVHGQDHLRSAQEAATYLGRLSDELQKQALNVDVHIHGRQVEDVAAAIDGHAHEFGVDLVALCKHGRSPIRDVLIGGIAQRLLRAGGTPILFTGPEPAAAAFSLHRILVPWDGEHESAVAPAVALAQRFEAEVRLMTAVPSLSRSRGRNIAARLMPSAGAATIQIQEDEALARLEQIRGRVASADVQVSTTLRDENAATAILEEAGGWPADLVVLATHARAGFEAWYSGSVGYRVITQWRGPLLLLREF